MPVFLDKATAARDLRVLPSRAPALPNVVLAGLPALSTGQSTTNGKKIETYDVVIAGAGPAGLMLTLLLSRYGINAERLLCVDSKPGSMKAGQADGLQPRTLEVFKSLGLADEILNEACQMWEVAFWNPTSDGIVRTSIVPDIGAPARYAQEFTIHQGRIERILSEDLARYHSRGVQYDTRVLSVRIDDKVNEEHPVVLVIESQTNQGTSFTREVRAKHVIGCDGARSVIRNDFNLELKGDTRDHIWGVIDLVIDTDFPDIRRRCAIHSEAGSVMVIPRERIPSGDYLTRLYIQTNDEILVNTNAEGETAERAALSEEELDARERARQKRANVTLEGLLRQAEAAFHPYKVSPKAGTEIDWWAAYQIGQRMADQFCVRDRDAMPRVFIAGDACHTHSPKAGQGMNVSMMDSYNLAWKLALHLQGLAPNPTRLLDTYETERRKIAAELIDYDHQFSSMFSGQIGTEDSGLTHEEFEQVFKKINGFTTGCGIEYPPGDIVWDNHDQALVMGEDYLSGVLKPGRRLFNVRVMRHADSAPWDLQDDFPSHGRFGILALATRDLLDPHGTSARALDAIDQLIEQYPDSLVQLSVLHNLQADIRGISWHKLPCGIKRCAEMRFYSARPSEMPKGQRGTAKCHSIGAEDAYGIYGVSPEQGALVVIRPDGYVGVISSLQDVERIAAYLGLFLHRK